MNANYSTHTSGHARRPAAAAVVLLCLATAALVAQTPGGKPPDYTATAKRALATLDGTMLVFGLKEPVEVLRDRWGIPHIFAKNTEDLFFAQGFVVAQDRMVAGIDSRPRTKSHASSRVRAS